MARAGVILRGRHERLAALAVNAGDANMRSVWICSRNDAIGNVAVMLAALGVFGTGSAWPDLLVAAVMGALALSGASSVVRHARKELLTPGSASHVVPARGVGGPGRSTGG